MSDLRLIVCENLARDARAVLEHEGWQDVEVVPCRSLCLRPHSGEAIAEEVAGLCDECLDRCVLVGCGEMDNLVRSRDSDPTSPRMSMVPCFDLLAGSSLVADWMRQGAYLLTPGWLDRWPEYIAEWGFDRTTARAFFEESVSKLVLLDTGTSSDSSARLEDFAHFIDRPWEVVPVGLDHLRLYLEQRLGARRVQQQQAVTLAELADTRRRLADYAMSYDLISRLATAKAEDLAIDGILESFEMISGPSALTYLPVKDGTVGEPRCVPIAPGADTRGLIGFADGDEPYARTESGDGLVLRIGEPGDTLGVLEFEHVALPRYLEHYLSLGLHLAPVCALAIRNARVFQELQATVSQLQEALANVKTLTGLIPICASCKKIRDDEGYWTQVEVYVASRSSADFTHGICPDCAERSLRGLERYLADRPGLPG